MRGIGLWKLDVRARVQPASMALKAPWVIRWFFNAMGLVVLAGCAETFFTTYKAEYVALVPTRAAVSDRTEAVILEVDFQFLDRAVAPRPPPTKKTHPSVWQHPYAWQGGINTAVILGIFHTVKSSFDVVGVRIRGTTKWDLDETAVSSALPILDGTAPADYLVRVRLRSSQLSSFGYMQGGLRNARRD